jgi:hypothetical protein
VADHIDPHLTLIIPASPKPPNNWKIGRDVLLDVEYVIAKI